MSLGELFSLILTGLIVGALARLAVPGPDPMPWWATILLGIAGAFLGGGLGVAILGGIVGAVLGSVLAASLLLIGYRKLVQKRPLTGPEARRLPR